MRSISVILDGLDKSFLELYSFILFVVAIMVTSRYYHGIFGVYLGMCCSRFERARLTLREILELCGEAKHLEKDL